MRSLVSALVMLLLPASALAEGPQPTQPQPVMQPVYAPQPEPEAQPEPEPEEGRGIQYGASLIVPVFFEPDLGLNPGVGFQLRVGWEFPGGLNLEIGYQMAFLGGERLMQEVDGTIWGFYFGARYAFLNPSALVPFIGVGAGLGLYSFDHPLFASGDSSTVDVYAAIGAQYELSANLGIDVGARFVYAFAGDITYFEETGQFLVMPFLGLTLYY